MVFVIAARKMIQILITNLTFLQTFCFRDLWLKISSTQISKMNNSEETRWRTQHAIVSTISTWPVNQHACYWCVENVEFVFISGSKLTDWLPTSESLKNNKISHFFIRAQWIIFFNRKVWKQFNLKNFPPDIISKNGVENPLGHFCW